MTGPEVVGLLVLGTLVGLDLVSGPQIMLSRPLVSGAAAGALLGDVRAGLTVGTLLELFQLDVLPVGAVRYGDYGIGAVAGTAAAAHAPGLIGTGVAVCLGLAIALAGEWSLQILRRVNTARMMRLRSALDAGEWAAIRRAHLGSWARDAVRSGLLTALGLVLVVGIRQWTPVNLPGALMLSGVAAGIGLAAAANGSWRLVGSATQTRLFALGAALGLLWVTVR